MKLDFSNNLQRDVYPDEGITMVESNQKAQNEAARDNFKRNAREIALRTAISNKPSSYQSQGLNAIAMQQQPNYDLLNEAEKIYNWMINDL